MYPEPNFDIFIGRWRSFYSNYLFRNIYHHVLMVQSTHISLHTILALSTRYISPLDLESPKISILLSTISWRNPWFKFLIENYTTYYPSTTMTPSLLITSLSSDLFQTYAILETWTGDLRIPTYTQLAPITSTITNKPSWCLGILQFISVGLFHGV